MKSFIAALKGAETGLFYYAGHGVTVENSNYLIAYATGPGDVAQDGSERNGVFSGAFIRQLKVPGVELSQMMKNIKAEVSATTANKQNPRVDDGMKENFYFVDPELAADRAAAQSASAKAQNELLNLAAACRAELDKLAQDGASGFPGWGSSPRRLPHPPVSQG